MDLVIRNTRLIDGTGADPMNRVSVEVSNGTKPSAGLEKRRLAHRGKYIKKTSTVRG